MIISLTLAGVITYFIAFRFKYVTEFGVIFLFLLLVVVAVVVVVEVVVVAADFSVVGIATRCSLDGRGLNPGSGEIFLAVRTRPEAHAVSCTRGTGYFPGSKATGASC